MMLVEGGRVGGAAGGVRSDTVSEYSDIPEGVSTLRHYVLTLWRRKWLFLAPIVILPIATFIATARETSLYEVTADVLVNRQEAATTSVIGQTPVLDDASRTMSTNAELARVPEVIRRAAEAADERVSPGVLRSRSTVYPVDDLLRFVVHDREPSVAAALATAYARQFVAYRKELDSAGLARTLRRLRGRLSALEAERRTSSALYARLADQQQQLESILALRLSNVSVVRTADAGEATQIAPRPRRNAALALAGGLVLGLLLVFLAETLSTKVRNADEVEARLGVPLLGRLAREPDETFAADVPVSDAFHRLRTILELENRRIGARTVLFTDIAAADGRSSVVARLAVALALSDRRVALVDLDLRSGGLTRLFGLADARGVTSLVDGTSDLDAALRSIPVGRPADRESHPARSQLGVLGAGPLPASAMETLAAPALAGALEELAERFDLVLVDAPSMLQTPDANALSELVDAAVVVVGAADARRTALGEARRALELWPAAKLGFVFDERTTPHGRWRSRRDRASTRALAPVTASEQPS